MARTRKLKIVESDNVLLRSEREARHESVRRRIRVLRTLKASPDLSDAELSTRAAVPKRTMLRWLAVYRERGLTGLLAMASHSRAIPPIVEAEIKKLILIGEFRTASEIRAWLKTEHRLSISLPTVASLVNRCAPLCRVTDLNTVVVADSESTRVALWLLSFLNALPERVDPREWAEELKRSLAELLVVDRVSIATNLRAFAPKAIEPTHAISIREVVEGDRNHLASYSVAGIDRDQPRAVQVIRDAVKQGLNLEDYHEPFCQEFVLSDATYLGTMILWKLRDSTDISTDSKALFVTMRDALTRLLIDCVARYEGLHAVNREFYEMLGSLIATHKLTPAEGRTATMRLLGHSYKDIAAALNTTVPNVGKTLTSVFKKTGAKSTGDLAALMFSPRAKKSRR